ncbi:MAG: sulfotransferase [Thermotogota bacterium]
MAYIKKNSVFISSTGRTGTQFFGKKISDSIEDCFSVHEPAVVWLSRPKEWREKSKIFGPFRMTIGQFLPSNSMFKLSADRAAGRIDDDKAREYVYKQRKRYVSKVKQSLYVESNAHLYGVLDLLSDIFPNCKIVYVIRDPRTWIRSALNTSEYVLYSPIDFRFFKASVRAIDFEDDPYYDKWNRMSKFEKYCWYYNKVNSYVLSHMSGKENFKIFRFEDLFQAPNKVSEFQRMLDFATDFCHRKYHYELKEEMIEKKVHARAKKGKLPHWREWEPNLSKIITEHCGRWFREYDYGKEKEWREKLKAAGVLLSLDEQLFQL